MEFVGADWHCLKYIDKGRHREKERERHTQREIERERKGGFQYVSEEGIPPPLLLQPRSSVCVRVCVVCVSVRKWERE